MDSLNLALGLPLDIKDIDFRIQSINNGGYATILAYKDARVDMARLDLVCGPLGWKREHEVIGGNLFCTVSVWSQDSSEWVSKQDVGTESMAAKEKGQASDAFKRACFNWGIGRELYSYPIMSIKLNQDEWQQGSNNKNQATWKLNLKEWEWYSEFNGGDISFLAAKDDKGKVRFKWGERNG